jgi:hypothetical protein
MSSWFKKILGGGSAEAKATAPLSQQLSNYPANIPAFYGDPKKLTADKQDANLAVFVQSIDQRLSIVSGLLSANGISVAALLAPVPDRSAAMAAADAIDRWLTAQADSLAELLPKAEGTQSFERYRQSSRADEDIVFSLAADLALLEGEAVRRSDPRFAWAICREQHLQRTFQNKRICLIRLPEVGETLPYVLEFELTVVDIFYDRISGRPPLRHYGKNLSDISLR